MHTPKHLKFASSCIFLQVCNTFLHFCLYIVPKARYTTIYSTPLLQVPIHIIDNFIQPLAHQFCLICQANALYFSLLPSLSPQLQTSCTNLLCVLRNHSPILSCKFDKISPVFLPCVSFPYVSSLLYFLLDTFLF